MSSGGVVSISKQQYKSINGHPNRFYGYGHEDHDMAYRLRSYNYSQDILNPGLEIINHENITSSTSPDRVGDKLWVGHIVG